MLVFSVFLQFCSSGDASGNDCLIRQIYLMPSHLMIKLVNFMFCGGFFGNLEQIDITEFLFL